MRFSLSCFLACVTLSWLTVSATGTTCTCYCSNGPTITAGLPFPQVGAPFSTTDSCNCLPGFCSGQFPSQCSGNLGFGIEILCSNTAEQCTDVAPLASSDFTTGWHYSVVPGPWLPGSMAMLKCNAGADSRLATPAQGTVFSATCTGKQWLSGGSNVNAVCTACDANTYNPSDSYERRACKPCPGGSHSVIAATDCICDAAYPVRQPGIKCSRYEWFVDGDCSRCQQHYGDGTATVTVPDGQCQGTPPSNRCSSGSMVTMAFNKWSFLVVGVLGNKVLRWML